MVVETPDTFASRVPVVLRLGTAESEIAARDRVVRGDAGGHSGAK